MTYTVKRNRSSFHIDGFSARTSGTGTDNGNGHVTYYAETTCGALTRGRFEDYGQHDTAAEALKDAEMGARVNNRKMCKNCAKAAAEVIAQES